MSLSICLLCTSFDIGGAETHVLTLAEALVREGHRVTVVSAGGVYEKRARGVFRHITLPLNKKRRFLYTLFSLRRLFKRERFDVIHSHARYPSFLCRLLGRRFVSTAHWVFSTRFPYRALSFWGEGVLAVSEDIKEYLLKNYGISEKSVSVTVNGMDKERFFSDKKNDGVYHIAYCSRLDKDRSLAAFLLCDAVERLYPFYPLTLSIIGDGEDFDAVRRRAEKINAKAKKLIIRTIGATDTVEEYLASADIFVGVSRAALEAMAAECAVILAGNEGYLSVFSKARAKEAEKTNFCCRGAEKTTAEALERDLRYLLSLPKELLHAQGRTNRLYVEKSYSAERMAKDALCLYERIIKKKAVLCGYYGFGNVGDDLMHRALSMRLRREGYGKILTLSAKKFSPSSLYAVYKSYDFFLGGGNLLQDESSLRSLRFYSACVRFALWRGCRVSLLSSGFGAFVRGGEDTAKKFLPRCYAVECRTSGDLRLARTLGAKNAHLSHDAVLELPLGIKKRDAKHVMLALRAPKEKKARLSFLSLALHLRAVHGKESLILYAMHPSDVPFLRWLSEKLSVPLFYGDAENFIKILRDCSLVYANRLHAGVCALRMGIPSYLLNEDEKCRFFAEDTEGVARSLSLSPAVQLFSVNEHFSGNALPSSLSVLRVCEELRGRKKGTAFL